MRALAHDLSSGAFAYAPFPLDHPRRAMEVDARFPSLSLGLIDASIVVLAEELGLRRIATRDVRHFSVVRLRDGRAMELVVHPTRADQS